MGKSVNWLSYILIHMIDPLELLYVVYKTIYDYTNNALYSQRLPLGPISL